MASKLNKHSEWLRRFTSGMGTTDTERLLLLAWNLKHITGDRKRIRTLPAEMKYFKKEFLKRRGELKDPKPIWFGTDSLPL